MDTQQKRLNETFLLSTQNIFHVRTYVLSGCLTKLPNAYLTHISLASFLWDVGKSCRSRPDAAERLIRVFTVYLQNVISKFE